MNYKKQHIKAVILVGSRDFGRCPLASRLQRALWPVGDKSVLQRLIDHIANQGVHKFVICGNSEVSHLPQQLVLGDHLDVTFLSEPLPRGTAGCILDAADSNDDELLFVFHAGIVSPPDIDIMAEAHHEANADMTIMFNPATNGGGLGDTTAQIYICEHTVVEHIPKAGYCDIKEGLIGELVRAGKTVHAAQMPKNAGNFRSWRQYLTAAADFLEKAGNINSISAKYKRRVNENMWVGNDVKIDSSAKILGPVLICDGARISEDVIIFGPAIIGQNVNIGRESVVENSVIWDGAHVGSNCRVQNCLLDYNAVLRHGRTVEEKLVSKKNGFSPNVSEKVLAWLKTTTVPQLVSLQTGMQKKLPAWMQHEQLNK